MRYGLRCCCVAPADAPPFFGAVDAEDEDEDEDEDVDAFDLTAPDVDDAVEDDDAAFFGATPEEEAAGVVAAAVPPTLPPPSPPPPVLVIPPGRAEEDDAEALPPPNTPLTRPGTGRETTRRKKFMALEPAPPPVCSSAFSTPPRNPLPENALILCSQRGREIQQLVSTATPLSAVVFWSVRIFVFFANSGQSERGFV